MEIKAQHHYLKDVETVFRFFSDPAAIKAKYEGVGARNIEVLQTAEQGELFLVKTRREVPAEVPAMLKKFFGAWNKVTATERWRREGGGRACEYDIEVSGPVQIRGRLHLKPEATGCVNEIAVEVTCGIPLVGKKIVELAAESTRQGIQGEYEYIRSHLAP